MNNVRYFFDIPVFRCSQDQKNKEYEEELKEIELYYRVISSGIDYDYTQLAERTFRSSLFHYFFNELVGMIRLFAIQGQIRAELFFVREKVTKKLKNKHWELAETKLFEYWVHSNDSNIRIYEWIQNEIKKISFENKKLKKRYVSIETFSHSGKYIDYVELSNF